MTMARISGARVVVCFAVSFALMELCEAQAEHAIEGSDQELDLSQRKSLVVAKSAALVIVFGVAFLGSVIPDLYSHRLLLGTRFAGGVFLTTALTRFHADSNATFKHLRPSQASSLTAMFTMMGYLLTMLAEVLVHRVYNRRAFQQVRNEDLGSVTDGPETEAAILRTMNLLDTVLLMLTLCFHSVFDGLAIGVSATTSETWDELLTVGKQKFDLATALGFVVLRLASPWALLKTVVCGYMFAMSTSVGVAIGIFTNSTDYGRTVDWIFAVWMGLGTGVFVYVATKHLLAWDDHKLKHKEQALFRWLAVLWGAVVVTAGTDFPAPAKLG